jgi:hypothetical protein
MPSSLDGYIINEPDGKMIKWKTEPLFVIRGGGQNHED